MKVKIIFVYTIVLLLSKQAYLLAIENKILFKVENKIITSIDIFNEINYLKIINKDVEKLGDEKIFQIAKNSLIKEKIKEIEILKKYKKIDLSSEFLEKRIINYYSKLGIKSIEDFNVYFKNQNLNVSKIKKKIAIQAYWNNLIYSIYSEKVVINKNKIRQTILNNSKKKTKSYLLSEIVFEVESKQEKNKKFDEVKESIIQEGFNNTAVLFSISLSSKNGGEIGWINENSLNQKIKNELNKISVGQNTDPIKIVGGFLILKINEIKTEKIKIDVDKELNKIINQKLNEQLNNFSNIYFNKIKKNIQIENI